MKQVYYTKISILRYVMKNKYLPLIALCLSALFYSVSISADKHFALDEWDEFFKSENSVPYKDWLYKQMLLIADDQKPETPNHNLKLPEFNGRVGLFITLMKDGKVRGCYGSFYPVYNDFLSASISFLKSALRADPRTEPLSSDELEDTVILVTIAGRPVSVLNPEFVDISKNGIYVKYHSGNSEVFVPGEILTIDYLLSKVETKKVSSYYQFSSVYTKCFSPQNK